MGLEKLVAKKLSSAEVEKLVRRLLDEILPLTGLEEARLFGSAARGEMTEASDLDIALTFDTPENATIASKSAHGERRESARWPTDILCVDRATYEEKSHIGGGYWIVREDGKVVYGPKDK